MDYNYTYGKGLDPQKQYQDNRKNLGADIISGIGQTASGLINKYTNTLNKAKEVVGNLALPGANLGTIAYGETQQSQMPDFNKQGNKFNYLSLFS